MQGTVSGMVGNPEINKREIHLTRKLKSITQNRNNQCQKASIKNIK